MNRENGFIKLENITDYDNIEGIHDNKRFTLDDKVYYYKSLTSKESAYYEVFTSYLANDLGINTVIYDLAVFDKLGVISEDFNTDNKSTITVSDILKEYNIDSNSLDLESINDTLLLHYKDESIRNRIMSSIVDTYILQAITGNIDVALDNLVIIEGETPTLAPNFDYSAVCMIDYAANIGEFRLNSSSDSINPKEDIINFLTTSNDYYKDRFNNLLSRVDDEFVDNIFASVSLNTNQIVDHTLMSNYKDYILGNIKELKQCFDNKKSASL